MTSPTVIVGRKGSAGAIHLAEGPSFPIDTTYYTRVRPGIQLDIRFLAYALRQLNLARLKTSTGVPGLSRDDAYRELFYLPPMAQQLRVVDLLSRADTIVRMRYEAETKAKEIIPALFLDMFGDPASNSKRWDAKPLGDLTSFVSGGTPPKSKLEYWDGELPWVSPKDMKNPEIADSTDHVSGRVPLETSIKLIPPEAVLIVVRGMILAHTVPVAITRTSVTINQDMKALIAGGCANSEYLMWLLRISQDWLLTLVTTAAHGTRKIDTERLQALQIPVPPRELQDEFVQRVNRLLGLSRTQSQAAQRAKCALQSLLGGAFAERK